MASKELGGTSSSSDECRSLLGPSSGSSARPPEGEQREGRPPQSRALPTLCYAISGILVLIFLSLHLIVPERKGSRGHLRRQRSTVPSLQLDGLVVENEAGDLEKPTQGVRLSTNPQDVVVGVEETGRQTGSGKSLVVTEDCVWHSCGNNTVCRLSATDDTNNGNETANRTWAVEPPRSAKSIYQSSTTTGTFLRPTTAPVTTRFDPVPGLPNLVSGVPASPRSKRLVPHAHRTMGTRVSSVSRPGSLVPRKGAWPRQGTENSLMFRNPLERRAAHDGWGEDVSLCASPAPGPQAQTTQATSGSELPTLQLR
eukprot:g1792.t1